MKRRLKSFNKTCKIIQRFRKLISGFETPSSLAVRRSSSESHLDPKAEQLDIRYPHQNTKLQNLYPSINYPPQLSFQTQTQPTALLPLPKSSSWPNQASTNSSNGPSRTPPQPPMIRTPHRLQTAISTPKP